MDKIDKVDKVDKVDKIHTIHTIDAVDEVDGMTIVPHAFPIPGCLSQHLARFQIRNSRSHSSPCLQHPRLPYAPNSSPHLL